MKMKMLWVVAAAAVVVVIAVVLATLKRQKDTNSAKRAVQLSRTRSVLTANEQGMYFRLIEALPELIVLAQVAHSALLTAKGKGDRNTFDKKRADFVLCDRAFQVRAVVELDDSSHDGNEEKDRSRDAALTGVGYRVVRYRGIPNADRVKADFASLQEPFAN